MLMNVEGMRRTHAEFVQWLFTPKHIERGFDFAPYGPADQGALNTFYGGLEAKIGPPDPNVEQAMEREHTASADATDAPPVTLSEQLSVPMPRVA